MNEFKHLLNFATPTGSELQNIKIHQDGHDMSICNNSNFVTEFRGSLFRKKNSRKAFHYWSTEIVEDFEGLLEYCFYKNSFDNKEDNTLICPSAFDHDKVLLQYHGIENVVFVNGIWLDFDGGDLSPKRLSELLPDIRMTIFSSFSSTKASLRFRVYTPTDKVMNVQQYKVITKGMAKTITAAGFYEEKSKGKSKLHKLDMTKLHAVSFFYLPCQPKDPSGAFFKVFNRKPRKPLNVQDWIDKYIAEEEANAFVEEGANTFIETPIEDTQFGSQETYAFIPQEGSGVDRDAVERACSDWHQCPQGEGNHEFFKLGQRLERAGCDQSEIVSILKEQACYARSPDKRLNQIPSILKSLQTYSKG